MIPHELKLKIERQPGQIHRSNPQPVSQALDELGVSLESEFGAFFLKYVITCFNSAVSDEELVDLLDPGKPILVGTRFIQQTWKMPERYICITSCQGEGAYLYDITSGEVQDFDLAQRADFLKGIVPNSWPSFFAFLDWYL